MKLVAEKIIKHSDFEQNPTALDQIRVILTTLLSKAVEKKIDWDAKTF
jgi:hypothetical protein